MDVLLWILGIGAGIGVVFGIINAISEKENPIAGAAAGAAGGAMMGGYCLLQLLIPVAMLFIGILLWNAIFG